MYWIWGKTGSGKSTFANITWPDAYIKQCNKWWDHYNDEDVVIIDEWDRESKQSLRKMLCNLGDKQPFSVEVKNDSIRIRPLITVVTANWSLEDCFPGD